MARAIGLLVLAFVLMVPAIAQAAPPEHEFLEVFGSANQPTFSEPQGLAINQASEDVLVLAHTGALTQWKPDGSADKFTSLPANEITGLTVASASESQLAVDNSSGATAGNIYVPQASPGAVKIFSSAGTLLSELTESSEGAFGEIMSVAVGPDGSLYVGEYGEGAAGRIHKYVPSGAFPVKADNTSNFHFVEVGNLAAGTGPTAGFIFAASLFGGPVVKLDAATGEEKYTINSAASTVSVDPASGHLYVAKGTALLEYDVSGATAPTEPVSETTLATTGFGVGINETTGNVYASREAHTTIEVFKPLAFPLTISKTGAGSSTITSTPAGINCGIECTVEFEEEEVELAVAPETGSEFTGWSTVSGNPGTCTGTTSPCTVTMSEAIELSANSDLEPGAIGFQVEPEGTGTGALECKDEGGSFEACKASYLEGHTITLKATATVGHSSFHSLTVTGSVTNTCTGSLAECTVKMESPGPVVATVTFNAIPHTLGIAIVGTGEVKCKVNGGGAVPCAPEYDDGTELELVPLPGAHFSFTGWSEGTGSISCTGIGNCGPFDLEANSSVKATFAPIKHTLGITIVGTGEAKCKVSGGSVEPCSPEYNEGTELELVPLPGAHFTFTGWSEGTGSISCTSTANCGPFHLEANSSVKATFTQITHTLTVTKVGTGAATIACKEDAGAFTTPRCSQPFNEGHQVTVRTTAGAGSVFAEYKGGTNSAAACNGVKTTECSFTIEADSTLEAESSKIARAFTVTINGNGSGTVECKVGVEPFGSCKSTYEDGDAVTIEAVAAAHSTLKPFSGGTGSAPTCNGKAGECTFTIKADSALTVTFEKITHTLSVVTAGTGSGSVTCNGGACASSYDEGTSVTIAATANSGSTFAGFSGGCSGTSCTVTMGANTSVTATFNANPPPPPPTVKCKVPKVKGLALGVAKSKITKAHCKVGRVTKPKAKKGKKLGPLVVKSSSPAAGAVKPEGTKVNLTLGPKPKKKH